jgi:hypothetical protein
MYTYTYTYVCHIVKQEGKKLSHTCLQMIWSYILKTLKTTKKPLDLVNTFLKGAGDKTNLQKSVVFLCAISEQAEKGIRKPSHS